MANIVMLNEPLCFGKYKDCTGAQLMKSVKGTKYLKWLWENTDVQIQDVIVHALACHKIIDLKLRRMNSRFGGGDACRLKDRPDFGEIIKEAAKVASRNSYIQNEAAARGLPATHLPFYCKCSSTNNGGGAGGNMRSSVIKANTLSKHEIIQRFRRVIGKPLHDIKYYS